MFDCFLVCRFSLLFSCCVWIGPFDRWSMSLNSEYVVIRLYLFLKERRKTTAFSQNRVCLHFFEIRTNSINLKSPMFSLQRRGWIDDYQLHQLIERTLCKSVQIFRLFTFHSNFFLSKNVHTFLLLCSNNLKRRTFSFGERKNFLLTFNWQFCSCFWKYTVNLQVKLVSFYLWLGNSFSNVVKK